MHRNLSHMSKFIAYKRESKKLKQGELAEKSNISRATLIKIENRTNSPSFETISNILDALDSSFTEFEEYMSNNSFEHIVDNFQMTTQDKTLFLKNFSEL